MSIHNLQSATTAMKATNLVLTELQSELEASRQAIESLKAQNAAMREAAQNYLVGPDKDEFHPVTGLACGCCGKDIDENGAGHEERCPVGIALSITPPTSYVSKEAVRPLVEVLLDLLSYAEKWADEYCNWEEWSRGDANALNNARAALAIARELGLLQ